MKSKKIKYAVFDIETAGLDPLKSRITCICAKTSKGEEIKLINSDLIEREILAEFLEWLERVRVTLLISANGKGFDLPFISMRAYVNDIVFHNLTYLLTIPHFDLINDITDRRISLDNILRLYRLPLKIGDGLQAIQLYKKRKFKELIDYCMNDVYMTEQAYLKYKKLKKKKTLKLKT